MRKRNCVIWICIYMFIAYIKTDYLYKNIAEHVETSFNTSNYELDRSFSKRKNRKVIKLMKGN